MFRRLFVLLLLAFASPLAAVAASQSPAATPLPPSPCSRVDDECFRLLEAKYRDGKGGLGFRYAGIRPANEAGFYSLAEVVEGGPADRAGLRAGDRIVAVNGRRLVKDTEADAETSSRFFHVTYRDLAEGATIALTVLRGGEESVVPVVAGPRTLEAARFYVWAEFEIELKAKEWARAYNDYMRRQAEPKRAQR